MRKSVLILGILLLAFPSLLKAGESSAIQHYNLGLTFYAEKHFEKALAHFLQAADENYDSWQSYEMAGYCYFQMMEKAEALEAFEQSLKINPTNSRLAKVYNDLKAGAADLPLRPVAESKSYYSGT
jgi:tetratricopeptide (TPR) repeat protein